MRTHARTRTLGHLLVHRGRGSVSTTPSSVLQPQLSFPPLPAAAMDIFYNIKKGEGMDPKDKSAKEQKKERHAVKGEAGRMKERATGIHVDRGTWLCLSR